MNGWPILVRQSARYLSGGLICAALHNALVIGATAAGIAYPLALVASFCATTQIGYLFHPAVTFGEPRSMAALGRFVVGSLAGFCWSAALMLVLRTGLGLPVAVATPLATAALFVWNFTAARWAIVRTA